MGKTICLAIDWFDSQYHQLLFQGVIDAGAVTNTHILILPGGAINSSKQWEGDRNLLFDFIGPELADGLILASGSLFRLCSAKETRAFCRKFDGLPAVSIGEKIERMPTVMSDNESGILNIITHLTEEHGYTRIAFISGPPENMDSDLRFKAYKRGLRDHNLPVDKNLIIKGDFLKETGRTGMLQLLKQTGGNIDAVIAANDNMAFGAQEALLEQGIEHPGNIAVIGFDDVEQSRERAVPLTTIRQPLYEIGQKAVFMMVDMLSGKDTPEEIFLPAIPVIRESCGCSPGKKHNSASTEPVLIIDPVGGTGLGRQFISCVMAEGEERVRLLEELVSVIMSKRAGETVLLVIDEFRQLLQQEYAGQEVYCNGIELLVTLQKELLNQYMLLYEKQLSTGKTEFSWFSDLCYIPLEDPDMDSFIHAISSRLPETTIKSLYCILFDDPSLELDARAPADLAIAWNRRSGYRKEAEALSMPPWRIVKETVLKNYKQAALLLEPLYFSSIYYGLILFEFDTGEYKPYINRMFLVNALNMFIIVKKSQSTLLELKRVQEQIVESAKMTALANLVTGVAHEINTPLGVSVTAASYLEDLSKGILGKIMDQNLKKSELISYVEKNIEISSRLNQNLKQIAELVSTFKKLSPVHSDISTPRYNLKKFLQDIVLGMSPRFRKAKIAIELICPGEIYPDSPPDSIALVITNLILNSLDHGFDESHSGKIILRVFLERDHIHVVLSDNGVGIPEDIQIKMFNPFFTTKRGEEHTGLGLHLVYANVIYNLKGSIRCDSHPGSGTVFLIKFPYTHPALKIDS